MACRRFTFFCGMLFLALAGGLGLRAVKSSSAGNRALKTSSPSAAAAPGVGIDPKKTRRNRPAGPLPRAPDAWILEQYSAEAEAAFYRDSDLGQSYQRQDFLNFFGLMRGALEGSAADLEAIFRSPPTDGAASEGFGVMMAELIGQLGDRYFAHHLGKQPVEVQRRILRAIWGPLGIQGTRVDGIPLVGDNHYPFTGRLIPEAFPELEE